MTPDEKTEVHGQIDQVANNASFFNETSSSVYADEVKDTENSMILVPNITELGFINYDERNISSCMKIEELGRYEQPTNSFQVQFQARIGIMYVENQILLSDEEVVVMSFNIQSMVDSGGTLAFKLGFMEKYLVSMSWCCCSFEVCNGV